MWYINMVLARDEHIQKHGVVNLMYNFNHYVEEVNLENTIHRMRSAMPLRLDAVHLCFKDPKMMDCATGVKLFIDQESRYRIRTHCGSQSEIDFELSTFGIPTHDSPMGGNGTWSTVFHHEWIAVQATREKGLCEHAKPNQQEEEYFGEDDNDRADVILDRENQVISLPRRFDVLFGKTKRARCATGTVRANHICEMHREKYEAANKFQKTAIAERIVGLVHESGGRFLIQQKTGGWVEVSHKQARDKIAHFFRHGRAKSKRNQESIDANNSRSTGTGVQRQGIKRVSPSTSPEPSTTHLPTSCDAEESSCSSQRSSVNE